MTNTELLLKTNCPEEYDTTCRFLLVFMKLDLLEDFFTGYQEGKTSLGEDVVTFEVWA